MFIWLGIEQQKHLNNTAFHTAWGLGAAEKSSMIHRASIRFSVANNRWLSLPLYSAVTDANRRGDKHSAGVRPSASAMLCVCVCVIDGRGQPSGKKCRHMLNGWVGTDWHKLLGQM